MSLGFFKQECAMPSCEKQFVGGGKSTVFGIVLGLGLFLGLPGDSSGQAGKRCDLTIKSTPGQPVGSPACIDLVALKTNSQPIKTADNATRISTDGMTICKSAFTSLTSGAADIVFIYDNSGSMYPRYAKIDSAANDTTYYRDYSGCSQVTAAQIVGPLIYGTAEGPDTVTLLTSAANCTGEAGDPYHVRAQVIRRGIDNVATTSPNSTAGAVGFYDDIEHLQQPLLLSVPGNAGIVKGSVVMDSMAGTNYTKPLTQANAWLNDTAITKTQKKAIVFISDGEPQGDNGYLDQISTAIPIYTIALGNVNFPTMQLLSTRSGGKFYQVSPKNIAKMDSVMQEIVRAITVEAPPQSVQVTNLTMNQVSNGAMRKNSDSSYSVTLDSIIGLKQGVNDLKVVIKYADNTDSAYNIKVDATGPTAATNTEELKCFDPPVLVMLNPQGQVDSIYPGSTTKYTVRLTRACSDLGDVVIGAGTIDSLKSDKKDAEKITAQRTSTGATCVNQRDGYSFDGANKAPVNGNNVLEADLNGKVNLTWTHPRDSRETATFSMPGKKVPIIVPYVEIERIQDAPRGGPINGPISDPIVIRGGVTLVRKGDSVTVGHQGCLSNCGGIPEQVSNPVSTPGYVFKTTSPFSYSLQIYDHLGQFMSKSKGTVNAVEWERMRGGADSLTVSMSIIPVDLNGARFATGVYILRGTITTSETTRPDPNRQAIVPSRSKRMFNRFGYVRAD